MNTMLAICIEDVAASHPAERYVRCVAVPGRGPGLRLGQAGQVLWRCEEGVACELWVTADDRLALWRTDASGRVMVSRAHRTLEVPAGKPVILVDQDELEVGGRRLRIHVHGQASEEAPPEPVPVQRNRAAFRAAATAVVLGATLAAGAAGAAQQSAGPVEVREHPPAPLPPPPPPPPPPPVQDAGPTGDPGETVHERDYAQPPDAERVPPEEGAPGADAGDPGIEVRDTPPAVVVPPSSGCCTRQPGTG